MDINFNIYGRKNCYSRGYRNLCETGRLVIIINLKMILFVVTLLANVSLGIFSVFVITVNHIDRKNP
jgi:hypothetical protein